MTSLSEGGSPPDLLPCPFCGEKQSDPDGVFVVENQSGQRVMSRQVECYKCSATGPFFEDAEKAVPVYREAANAAPLLIGDSIAPNPRP